jgi:signal transduction histidine kinase
MSSGRQPSGGSCRLGRAAKHGVTVHFSADEGPLIQADRTRLAQVIDNLIVNAVKFSGPNGRQSGRAR